MIYWANIVHVTRNQVDIDPTKFGKLIFPSLSLRFGGNNDTEYLTMVSLCQDLKYVRAKRLL